VQLNPGMRLGPYEILSPLGAGGMGEVYRARDARLGRDVAIKTLPEAFASDAERLSRFEREARLLASLNHSNVAAIHGIEEVGGRRHLVLEFVDGETLAERLSRGPLPVDEAIDVCKQIAAGVEAAHESGVVHRDLKPGNVILTPAGQVKVLDFGLAVSGASGASGSDPNLSHSPTLTHQATRAGVILGTAAYMSPEQARGRGVDRRTDIWSFGCVLYECLTGRQLYQGDTVSDLIARILEREPDWSALPANTPPRVRELLKKCLRKDPKERLRDIGDARLELSEAHVASAAPAEGVSGAPGKNRLPWMIATGVLALALGASFLLRPATERAPLPTLRLSVPVPPSLGVSVEVPDVVMSPDGSTVLFVAVDSAGVSRLYLRSLANATARVVPGTEGAAIPFWAPDGNRFGFFADGVLKRMGVDDDRAQTVCPAPNPRGAAWSPGDVIVFAPGATGPLLQVPASGGTPTAATTLDSTLAETAHRFPQFLPDGKHFLYVALPGKDADLATRVGNLDASIGPIILHSPNIATYAAPGYLLFDQAGSVVAQPFDAGSLTLSGSPRAVRDLYNVSASYTGSPVVMASRDGTLIQREFSDRGMRIDLVDRTGRQIRAMRLPEGRYFSPTFSPDGTRLAVTYSTGTNPADRVWVIDVARGVSTRFGFKGSYDTDPMWTVDGSRLIWGSDRGEGRELVWRRADGSGDEELLADIPNMFNDVNCVTRDYVVYRSLTGETSEDIWIVSLTGDPNPRPLIQTRFAELDAAVSPDERWMAYRSDESGRFEVYVVAFPGMDQRVRVSTDGAAPQTSANLTVIKWRSDGRELYYVGGDGRTLMSVPVETGESFSAGTPRPLMRFSRDTLSANFAPDGQTLAVITLTDQGARGILSLVFNWASELEGSK